MVDNPATSYPHGAGPIAVKTLADLKVNVVMVVQLGVGASNLLEHFNIQKITVEPNVKVADTIRKTLKVKV